MSRPLPFLAALLGLALLPRPTLAADSYDSCSGHFIDSLPATIGTQGVWCLRKDLATSMASGAAITITTNNVTIDCNQYKLGGLGAGDTTNANGITATDRNNITVRNCNIRGFAYGIALQGNGTGGHLVEDNRLDNNTIVGIYVEGDNNMTRRNRVYATGGRPTGFGAAGIMSTGEINDNVVSGVFTNPGATGVTGIIFSGTGGRAHGNVVSDLVRVTTQNTRGIAIDAQRGVVEGNAVIGAQLIGTAIAGNGEEICSNNKTIGFSAGITSCLDGGGNTQVLYNPGP